MFDLVILFLSWFLRGFIYCLKDSYVYCYNVYGSRYVVSLEFY